MTQYLCFIGQGNTIKGVKCTRSKMSGNRLRRRSRTIPRFDGVIQDRRT